MQRYFVGERIISPGEQIVVTGEDFHHIVRVMRMKAKQTVQVVAGGQAWLAEIVDIGKESVQLQAVQLIARDAEPAVHVTLVQGLPKGEKIDSIIRQSCEVGVSRLVIFSAERSVGCLPWDRREQRLTRWRRMAKESAEQAQRSRIPVIDHFDSLDEALRSLDQNTVVLVPYEAQDVPLPSLKKVLSVLSDRAVLQATETLAIVIGPEGGFDPKEILVAQAAGGHLLTLGPRIMRTETAGAVVAAIVLYDLLG